MTLDPQPALVRPATMTEAGRPCPYCRFPLKESAGVIGCGACGAVHHDDCFYENHGCAVLGCAGANTAVAAVAAPPVPAAAPPAYATVTQWTPPPPPPAGSPAPPDLPAPPPVPAWTPPPPAAGNVRTLPTGATVKIRHPLAVLALILITLGFYGLYWWYQINRELRDYGRARGAYGLGDSPGASLAAYALGGFLLYIPTIWTIVGTSGRIRRAQAAAGVQGGFEPAVAALLWIFTLGIGGVAYTQAQLNATWRRIDDGAVGLAPTTPGGSRTAWLAAAVVVLVVALIGTTATFLLTRDDTSAADTETLVPPDPTVDSSSSEDDFIEEDASDDDIVEEPAPVDTNGVLPDVGRATMRADIEAMLSDWHWAVVDGDYGSAWRMLTARKRTQKLAEEGRQAWVTAQASLSPYLDPSGLHVRIIDMNPDTGVVTVKVTGMGWSKPGSRCSTWSGITWVKYESDRWMYDPGYSTTRAREREWSSRYDQLMGVGC